MKLEYFSLALIYATYSVFYSVSLIKMFCLFITYFVGDATLSRHKGINLDDLALYKKMCVSPSGELWRGKWQGNEIMAKILRLRECTPRIVRDFNDQFPKLR